MGNVGFEPHWTYASGVPTASVMSDDPFQLQRFLDAQAYDYETALAELQSGRKRSHWIWYIFPQVAGLGRSSMAEDYAIRSAAEAKAYLEHPVLGLRLKECCQALLLHRETPIEPIMGHPDDLKLKSSMTLFAEVGPNSGPFGEVLKVFYQGRVDRKTIDFLSGEK